MANRDSKTAHGGTTAPRTGGQQLDEGNRQEGNKDRQRGGGDERQQQLRNHGQEGGKTARRDNE